MTFKDLFRLAFQSLPQPRESLRTVLSLGFDRVQAWQALILTVIISTLLGEVMSLMISQAMPLAQPFLATPLLAFFVQLCLLIVAVFSIFWIGRAMGGSGTVEGAILLVAWLQFILVILQVVQIFAILALPFFAGWLGVFGIGLFFWLITYFVAELHGFTQPGKVFLMVLASLLGIAFGLSLILSMIGIATPGA